MKNLRLGIIGASDWAEMMYLRPLVRHPRADLVAICARSTERTNEVAARYSIPNVFHRWREMISTVALDAVAVVTPDDTHADIACAALEKGLHVLCEKPLAMTGPEAWSMVDRAEDKDLYTQVFFTWRWQPHFMLIKDLIAERAIGAPRRAELSFRGGFVRDNAYHWRLDPGRAGGALTDLGAHMVDLGLWFFGSATEVLAHAATLIDRGATPGHEAGTANDTATLLLRMGGVETVIDVSAATPMGDRHMEHVVRIEGDEGAIECRHIFGGQEAGLHLAMARDAAAFHALDVPNRYFSGPKTGSPFDYFLQSSAGARAFVDDVVAGNPPKPSFFDGAMVQDILDAALISAAEGRRAPVTSSANAT